MIPHLRRAYELLTVRLTYRSSRVSPVRMQIARRFCDCSMKRWRVMFAPDTFPVAIRMLKPGEAIPESVKVPSRITGEQWIVCQSIGIALRCGWSIAVGKDDVICPLAAIAFGFRSPNDEYLRGFTSVGIYCKDEQAATNLEASTWRFEPGTYDYLCIAPLNRLRQDRYSDAYDQRIQCDFAVHWRSRVWHGSGQ